MKNKKNNTNLFFFVLIFTTIIISVFIFFRKSKSAQEVLSTKAVIDQISEYVEEDGVIELDRRIDIFSEVSGKISIEDIKENDFVDSTQLLANIDSSNLFTEIDKSSAMYDVEKSRLAEINSSITPEMIKDAEIQHQQAISLQEKIEKEYENNKSLALLQVQKAQSDKDLATSELAYWEDQASKGSILFNSGSLAENDLTIIKQKKVEAESKNNIADITLENAKKNLEKVDLMLKEIDVAKDNVLKTENNISSLTRQPLKEKLETQNENIKYVETNINNLRKQLEKYNIYASMNGTIISKYIDSGFYVNPGTKLFEIGDLNSAYLSVKVLTDDINKIVVGQKAIITGAIINDDELVGEVYYIAPKAESIVSSLGINQQKIEVRVRFDNIRAQFKPGYKFEVKILTTQKDTLIVEESAVFNAPLQQTLNENLKNVFIINELDVLELRTVEIGIKNDDVVEILSGLNTEQLIVNFPDSKLKENQKVKVITN